MDEYYYKAPCRDCGGKCCQYIAIEIDRPTTKKGYDFIRWYLLHKNTNVFVDHDSKWHVEFRTECEEQESQGRCEIYDRRPKICRDHGIEEGDCEYYDLPYSLYFTTESEFITYLEGKGIDWRYREQGGL
ncbi:MAG: zinc/iron-chelating domain-containing protein [Spirochaetae bacterium HGW-Spirochaetae-1]|jgi:Fe-S-cluster containining protein|nr:MAG: zinc/iron-chelating domain-containing protein [Spirochaetae bacterium HGW-Spirochaetae-1]